MLNWFKRGVGEMMIARPDDAKAFVVWKHPDPTIPMKSQLTVMADEEAIFMRDGKVVETLGPGRHTLDSSNLPFLSNLVDSFTGGDVLRAEVFFVSKREHPGIKFGGRVGHVEDPKSGVPCELMVHGEFSFKVEDGYIAAPGAPGLGIEVDEELARAHPFTGDDLHLNMQEAPCGYQEENIFEGGSPAQVD